MGILNAQNIKTKTGELLTLRSATASDAKKLNALASDVFKSSEYLITTPEEFSSFTDDQQVERIKTFEVESGHILLVVEHKNELIGMLDFQNGKRNRIAHAGSFGMSVKSTWRSKGIGEILLKGLIEWVKAHPTLEVINLGVLEGNKPAIALYSKMGFEITGKHPFFVKLSDGKYVADLSMSLRVKKS